MSKVIVESRISQVVVLSHPAVGTKMWEKKGAKKQLDFEALQEAMYEDGVKYLFDSGILYIADMEQKKELDLEPLDATEPTNIINLSDEEVVTLLKSAPMNKFKETLAKLSEDQIREIARAAIALRLNHLEKAKLIKEKCGIDVLKSIEIEEAEKIEDVK